MGNGWTDFFGGPAPAPPYPGLGFGTPSLEKSYSIPDIRDMEIPEDKKLWFGNRFGTLKQQYPYRTDRDILQLVFTEMGYQEEPSPIETIASPSIPIGSDILEALRGGWNYLQGLRGETGIQIPAPGTPPTPKKGEKPLEVPRANAPMPKVMEAGTKPTYGGGIPQAVRPGVSDWLAQQQRQVEDIGAGGPTPQVPTTQPTPVPEQGAATGINLPAPPVRPDFAEQLRGIGEAMPKTAADIIPRPMAPRLKNIWLEALRYSLPAATGQDPYKIESEKQRVLDEQWIRDLGIANTKLNFKQQAEIKILEKQMVDYDVANTGYREVLKDLGSRFPGMENNPNFLPALMQTYHMTEKTAKEFMEANKRPDGTYNLGDKKAQKIQEIKTQVEVLREFLPGYPDDMLADIALGGQFKITVEGIKGSLMATIISPNTTVEKKQVAMKQLGDITKLMKATGEDQKIVDKLGLLYKMKDAIVPTHGKGFFDDLVKRTWQHEFGGVPAEPKEPKEGKMGEVQKQFNITQTTTGLMGIFFSVNPDYLKDPNGEATRSKMEEWNNASSKYRAGQEFLDNMVKTKPVTPEQESAYWKANLTPQERNTINSIKEGHKRYIMKDMITGDLRRDPSGRPRAEILSILGDRLSLKQWEILVGWIELKDAKGNPAISNEKILQVLGVK